MGTTPPQGTKMQIWVLKCKYGYYNSFVYCVIWHYKGPKNPTKKLTSKLWDFLDPPGPVKELGGPKTHTCDISETLVAQF